ncbi:MAG: gliding motility lipoprotein GldD [Flavobacterium sp.]|nr:gliding motility lipoprotein GldD [Flavobacterium sp.]
MFSKKKYIVGLTVFFSALFFLSCKDVVLPKPASQLRLEYPVAKYDQFSNHCPFIFEMNSEAIIKEEKECGFTISYPKMKATIYLTYKPVSGNIVNLLRDAQKLTYEHVIKADDILEQPFLNPKKKVYGMFYKVSGNAATNAQFYVTDSTKHFLTGSVYFYAKPNFDSIMPAAEYIRNDIKRLVETVQWK